jgi:hypothetical protein
MMPRRCRPCSGRPRVQITPVAAGGAYDTDAVYQEAAARQRHRPPVVVIPPRTSAVLSTDLAVAQSQRDRHIAIIADKGRMAWQQGTDYGCRNQVETAIGRYKQLIGPKLRARSLLRQQGEVAIAVAALNTMIPTAKPMSVRAS